LPSSSGWSSRLDAVSDLVDRNRLVGGQGREQRQGAFAVLEASAFTPGVGLSAGVMRPVASAADDRVVLLGRIW
jgi:hypothetical protein